jgi:replicative DNA helicase
MASMFKSKRHQEIFQAMSKRYSDTETAEATERKKRADDLKRLYFASFRQDALRLAYDHGVAEELLRAPSLSLS